MKSAIRAALLVSLCLSTAAFAQDDKNAGKNMPAPNPEFFKAQESVTQGSVTANGTHVDYTAHAGTLIVHPKDWDDASEPKGDKKDAQPIAEMFYVAYFKNGVDPTKRPITFLYNGGPGSSTVWLHMGAFGPRRIVTADDTHTPSAPYQVVNNDESLLDASDLVFIDAPGTGFSRIAGKDKEKAFYGVDPDAYAFAQFISEFLGKYGRWNSPKYLFGESYGTPRSAVLVNELETDRDIDFNGVILLSQILNFDLSADRPEYNPGIDLPYQVALPTYAATAWYHHRLPPNAPKDLPTLIRQAEGFAMGEYGLALERGASIGPSWRKEIIAKLHMFTGLPASYIDKANLRIDGGEFEKSLEGASDTTVGRLDTRFSGPTLDPLSERSDYDPQSAAISSAYVSAFNDYVRRVLNFGGDREYKPEIPVFRYWDFKHQAPGVQHALRGSTNTMPDLANAMKFNPNLKILLNGGYFDLATPFYEGWYEMHHLQIPAKLQANITYRYYQSGHMVYAHAPALKQLHDNVAAFIEQTDNVQK
ncbi:MAG: S10 family peptidase [Rhizomicrobium sp.]